MKIEIIKRIFNIFKEYQNKTLRPWSIVGTKTTTKKQNKTKQKQTNKTKEPKKLKMEKKKDFQIFFLYLL